MTRKGIRLRPHNACKVANGTPTLTTSDAVKIQAHQSQPARAILIVRQSEVRFRARPRPAGRVAISLDNRGPPNRTLAVHALLNGHHMRLAYALYRSPLALPVRPLL